jgi:hypothetical protein
MSPDFKLTMINWHECEGNQTSYVHRLQHLSDKTVFVWDLCTINVF